MKKASLFTIGIVSVLTLLCGTGFTIYNIGMCSSYRLGLYQETTMEKFLKEEPLHCKSGTDSQNKIRDYLSSVSFTDEGNTFPYQYQKNTCYVEVVLTTSDFYFRMDENYTKVALEKRDYRKNDSTYFCAVRYYSCTSEAGSNLVKLMEALL